MSAEAIPSLHVHLQRGYEYMSRVCLVSNVKIDWVVLEWAAENLNGLEITSICMPTLWGSIYYLWHQRKAIIHNSPILTEEQILAKIKQDVRGRLEFKAKFPNTNLNRVLYNNWGFNNSILLPTD